MKPLSPTVRLSAAYLAILMTISIAFSVVVYRTSVASLEEGFLRQTRVFQQQPLGGLSLRADLERARLEQLNIGRHNILFNLIGINLAIVVLGGLGSYLLAQRTLRPIEEALEAQTRFTADASHELRTPLTAMQTEIEVALRDQQLKLGEAKALLGSNLEEVAKLRGLTEGLLALSRHQRGEAVPMSRLDISEVVQAAIKRLQPIIERSHTTIEVKGNDVALEGDRDSLVSLLVILIENAIKYSVGPPRLTITTATEHRQLLVRVSDQGVGIKPADLPHIFDRFFRADSSRSKHTAGYGLGLAIAKQISELHHGNLSAASKPKKGTTMTIKLPLRQPKFGSSLD